MLPIKRIVLYKHGVGYFERQGEVEDDAAVDLHFKAAEMNDVLKSLTVLDMTSGLISSISYESTRPLEKQLDDIAIRLEDRQVLVSFLGQIKGAGVRLEIGSRQIEGVVTGIQKVTSLQGDHAVENHHLVVLVEGSSLESIDLLQVKRFVLLDESLQKDLQHLLGILHAAGKKDLKRLTIFARGQGKRELLVGYTVEAPVWKTSYRVLLDDASSLLQGWAMVDNTGDEDWNEIGLSLVAGLPVSFVHDLYSPRYRRRPVVQVQEEEAYGPPVLEEAVMMAFEAPPAAPSWDAGLSASLAADAPAWPAPAQRAAARARSVPIQTRTVEVGDLFQYDIKNPVTVKRAQSALVPIAQEKFEGKRVAVYNASVRDKNPMTALLFKNTTGLMLEGGPMTVFENEAYVGEAMLDTIKPNEERIVPYSVELGCVVGRDNEVQDDTVAACQIAAGKIFFTSYRLHRHTYLFNNKGTRVINLFLDHPIMPEAELDGTPAPAETTASYYRFRFDLPPHQTTRFPVQEKTMVSQQFVLKTINSNILQTWLAARQIPSGVIRPLQELVAINDGLMKLQTIIQRRQEDIKAIEQSQARLRQNLQALGNNDDEKTLRERYVRDLSTDEDTLKGYRQEIKQAQDEGRSREEDLNRLISGLRV
ncbi:MAG TPA: hypothetical protein VGO93_09995 [Candidatus Xenobia bacterium]